MKVRILAVLSASLLTGTLAFGAGGSWTGYITDSKCGVKGAHEGTGDCAAKCVKEGAKYVFVDDADKKVNAIDAPDKVAPHAGHHVTVKGTVEGDTLRVDSIEMAPAK